MSDIISDKYNLIQAVESYLDVLRGCERFDSPLKSVLGDYWTRRREEFEELLARLKASSMVEIKGETNEEKDG